MRMLFLRDTALQQHGWVDAKSIYSYAIVWALLRFVKESKYSQVVDCRNACMLRIK